MRQSFVLSRTPPRVVAGSGGLLLLSALLWLPLAASATPANKAALAKHYDRFLAKRLNACVTCHLPGKENADPTSLKEFPHNPFGTRLRLAAEELRKSGQKPDLHHRLALVAKEDSDRDGVDNETELLLGHAPGDPTDKPSPKELTNAKRRLTEFRQFLAGYRWQPFEPVKRPPVPKTNDLNLSRNPIDAFLAAEHQKRGLRPRPEAPKILLLRRVTLDLTGLSPTPEEIRAFEADTSPNAYEKVVDRLLASPAYGERWGRHWMDIWRYSDWAGWNDGGQIRDSKPHIWRWRDWIVESLNADKPYDRMVQEMLAADELAPEDPDALRATGFLVRNYKLLSREQWMEDTVGHTFKAFLGVTMHCAKCHDHMYDPITQADYYRVRAIFEPHNVRTDRIPGQADTNKDGLVRAYDADPKAITYFFLRGDERHPDKDRPMPPGVPPALGGAYTVSAVKLPRLAYQPDRRDFVVQEARAAAQQAIQTAEENAAKVRADVSQSAEQKRLAELALEAAKQKADALEAVLQAEGLEDAGQRETDAWKRAAEAAVTMQRAVALTEARQKHLAAQLAVEEAKAKADETAKGMDKAATDKAQADLDAKRKALMEADKALAAAEQETKAAPSTQFKPRSDNVFPPESTGRRLAFAKWVTDARNPLTARVAVNHIWARHFGQGIVPSTADFGRNGRAPSHPQLLDWLAAEFMAQGWRMKPLHRMIVTSRAYRMASTPDTANLQRDPDNVYLWRMSSRRLEAEAVRDNVLFVAGSLDRTMGGPDIDHTQGLTSRRRSIYLRHAAEKQAEFLQIFDGPSVTECYERRPSVMPQQALALANSELALREARTLAGRLLQQVGPNPGQFIEAAFLRILARRPTAQEKALCLAFLAEQAKRRPASGPQTAANGSPLPDLERRARENLTLVLFNHNDFVTAR